MAKSLTPSPDPHADVAAKVTKEYVLAKFVEILDSDANWPTKVRALELMGKFLNMFVDKKQVNIDIKQLVAGIGERELRALAGEDYAETGRIVGRVGGEHIINMQRCSGDGDIYQPDSGSGGGGEEG